MVPIIPIFWSLVVALDIWALAGILATGRRRGGRLLWGSVSILLPVVGFVFWRTLGPRPKQPRVGSGAAD